MRYRARRINSRQFSSFSKARSFYSKFLKALMVYASDERYAFGVGKRVSKSAVVRNKLKRRLRHIVAQNLTALPQGQWILFVARKEAAEIDFQTLEADFKKLLTFINTKKSANNAYKGV